MENKDLLANLCDENCGWMFYDLNYLRGVYTIGYKHSPRKAKKFTNVEAALAEAFRLVDERKNFLNNGLKRG